MQENENTTRTEIQDFVEFLKSEENRELVRQQLAKYYSEETEETEDEDFVSIKDAMATLKQHARTEEYRVNQFKAANNGLSREYKDYPELIRHSLIRTLMHFDGLKEWSDESLFKPERKGLELALRMADYLCPVPSTGGIRLLSVWDSKMRFVPVKHRHDVSIDEEEECL